MKKYNFNTFMEAVDEGCWDLLGCSAHDLPDYPYNDDWQECEEELSFIAPEDEQARSRVFRNNVSSTCDQVLAENNMDNLYPQWM